MSEMPPFPKHNITPAAHLLRYFDSQHLPEHLAAVSRPFQVLANEMVTALPGGPELTAGLRKLLEAKDCFVRAAVDAHRDAAEQR